MTNPAKPKLNTSRLKNTNTVLQANNPTVMSLFSFVLRYPIREHTTKTNPPLNI